MGNEAISSWMTEHSIIYIGVSTLVLGLLPLSYFILQFSSHHAKQSSNHGKDASHVSIPSTEHLIEDIHVDPIVEISVSDIESAYQAWSGGANSLELCANRSEGGTTPSLGLVEECVSRFQLPGCCEIHILLRPRPGNFVYSGTAIISRYLNIS